MRSALVFILAILVCNDVSGQLGDTLHEVFSKKPSYDARLESRNSFIDHQLISVTGVRLGVTFKRKLRVGGGVSWLKSDVSENFLSSRADLGPVSERNYLKFVYLCYYVDFVFHKTKRWQLSVPIQIGGGYSWFQKGRGNKVFGNDSKYLLLLYEPGITAQFKIFKWLGLGSDVAYRFTANKNDRISGKLVSPTFSFKALFWFDQLFYDLLPNHPVTKKFGPAYW